MGRESAPSGWLPGLRKSDCRDIPVSVLLYSVVSVLPQPGERQLIEMLDKQLRTQLYVPGLSVL